MLKFKEFLTEGIVTQLQRIEDMEKKAISALLNSPINTSGDISTKISTSVYQPNDFNLYLSLWGGEKPVSSNLSDMKISGTYYPPFSSKGKNLGDVKVYGDPNKISDILDPLSDLRSTLRHEFGHADQARQAIKNDSLDLWRRRSRKYDDIKFNTKENPYGMTPDLFELEYGKDPGKKASYVLSADEVNARGVQRSGEVRERQNADARRLQVDPNFMTELPPEQVWSNSDEKWYNLVNDYELDLEKSKGKLNPPEFNSDLTRKSTANAIEAAIETELERYPNLKSLSKFLKPSDAKKLLRDIEKAKRSVLSDIGTSAQENMRRAEEIARDAYAQKTTDAIRERQIRVANTRAQVARAMEMDPVATSLSTYNPSSTADFLLTLGGELPGQQYVKPAAALDNPYFSPEEQFDAEARLRGLASGSGMEYVAGQLSPAAIEAKKKKEEAAKQAGKSVFAAWKDLYGGGGGYRTLMDRKPSEE